MGHRGEISRKSRSVTLQSKPEYALNEAGRDGASTPTPALTDNANVGGPRMAAASSISPVGDSTNAFHTPDNWKPLGDLARLLAEKAGGAK